jgi:hypothetical protein
MHIYIIPQRVCPESFLKVYLLLAEFWGNAHHIPNCSEGFAVIQFLLLAAMTTVT